MTNPKHHYPEVAGSPDLPSIEEATLQTWKKEGTFRASVENRGNHNEFVFYDGPPFANGLPHYGHLLTSFVKDTVARYQTMKGKKTERRFGWDCHGLPAEMESEKELGVSGRAAIEAYGIEKFNEHCRESVMKYTHIWQDTVTRAARWVDFEHDYKTMDLDYMESVIWAFNELYKKGLIYESHRVMPYSWAAETPLSNFETRMDNSYRDREDKAITVSFKFKVVPNVIKDAKGKGDKVEACYILAWTTTPWTLPSNLALAVGQINGYSGHISEDGKICYICSTSQGKKLFPDHHSEKEEEIVGDYIKTHKRLIDVQKDDLLGLSYEPLFPYFKDTENAFRVLDGSDFIEEGSGTGIVHMAPGFGEDDQRVCEKNDIPVICPVDEKGRFTDDIIDLPKLSLKGLNVLEALEKSANEPYTESQLAKYGLVNLRIITWLKENGQLVKQEDYKHSYPHCWRTDKPLIYRALPSWYVEVTKFKDRMVALNQKINWIPEHIKDGQMGNWLEGARDWSISRNRFWGTPIPIWRSNNPDNKAIFSFGSLKEIEDFFLPHMPENEKEQWVEAGYLARGRRDTDARKADTPAPTSAAASENHYHIIDLHKPFVDALSAPDSEDPAFRITRTSDVFDCWFESGSMPFAQVHYPFENKDWFNAHFPADFIVEYVGQTRGWFYTLIVLATALFDSEPFKNCICHGIILDSEGKKLSKRLRNYPDPNDMFNTYGADAMRARMLKEPIMHGGNLLISKDGNDIRDTVRLFIQPIWNSYRFFTMYANADGVKAKFSTDSAQLLDRYILAKCRDAVEKIDRSMAAYLMPEAYKAIEDFFEALNNWYIRRSRERFWSEEQNADKQAAYDTLFTVITTMMKASASLIPLVAEEIYTKLTGEKSVHLADFPDVSAFPKEVGLTRDMDRVRDICATALALRNEQNMRVRQPLNEVTLATSDAAVAVRWKKDYGSAIADIIKDEINVKHVNEGDMHLENFANFKLSIHFPILGKRLPEKMKQIIPASKKGEWKQLPNGRIEICGEELLPEEATLDLEPKPEFAKSAKALSTNDALVVLDLNLTPELIAEGVARDLVRAVQEARKNANLNIADRIELAIEAPDAVKQAATANQRFIEEQTLSKLRFAATSGLKHVSEVDMDGALVKIGLSKAA
ncbi:MAG: isoleucine--tRNA ligase [Proteobacteria bacterium]|nr:isoleucine--tRNA ligase [Pseudomonadota bacterium]